MAQSTSLVCKECSHVNEAQRVYCHNCGVKLDRTSIAQELQKSQESNEQKQRRVKKMMSPGGGILGPGAFKSLFRAIFWGAVVGFAINLARTPDDVPPMPKDQLPEAPPLNTYLQDLNASMTGRIITIKEDDINLYLQSVLRPKGKKEGGLPAKFERAFVKVNDGTIHITSQSSLFNHPIYMGVTFAANNTKGNLTTKPVALHLGRITVPEFISQHLEKPVDLLFSSLWGALKEEHKEIDAVGAMELRKGVVVLASPGTDIPPAPAAAPALATP